MGIWFPSVGLAEGEQVRYQAAANSFRGRRSIGGQLTVTEQRLIFTPNRLDGLAGGRQRVILLDEVRDTQTLKPGLQSIKKRGLAAAIRPQIEISEGSDSSLIVTVRDPDRLIGLLRR